MTNLQSSQITMINSMKRSIVETISGIQLKILVVFLPWKYLQALFSNMNVYLYSYTLCSGPYPKLHPRADPLARLGHSSRSQNLIRGLVPFMAIPNSRLSPGRAEPAIDCTFLAAILANISLTSQIFEKNHANSPISTLPRIAETRAYLCLKIFWTDIVYAKRLQDKCSICCVDENNQCPFKIFMKIFCIYGLKIYF